MIARTSRRCALRARLMGRRRGRAVPGRQRAVQVGDRVALAGDVGPEGWLRAQPGPSPDRRGGRAAPERVPLVPLRRHRRAQVRDRAADRGRAARREEAQRGAVAVEGPALARQAGGRVAELLVVRDAGGEVVAGARVVQDDVAGRQQDVVDAAAGQADLARRALARRPRTCRRPDRPRAAGRRCSRARPGRAAAVVWSIQGCEAAIVAGSSFDARRRGRGRRPAGRATSGWCGAATARRSQGSGRAA